MNKIYIGVCLILILIVGFLLLIFYKEDTQQKVSENVSPLNPISLFQESFTKDNYIVTQIIESSSDNKQTDATAYFEKGRLFRYGDSFLFNDKYVYVVKTKTKEYKIYDENSEIYKEFQSDPIMMFEKLSNLTDGKYEWKKADTNVYALSQIYELNMRGEKLSAWVFVEIDPDTNLISSLTLQDYNDKYTVLKFVYKYEAMKDISQYKSLVAPNFNEIKQNQPFTSN